MIKKYSSLLLISILLASNIYTVCKSLKLYRKINQPPLIERVYSTIANQMVFEDPIVFTGDSMIHRMNWNYIFQKINNNNGDAPIPVIFNLGIGGNTTDQLLRRFESNILKLKPKAVFVEIGTNDLKGVNETNHELIEKHILSNYQKIIKLAINHDEKLRFFIIPILPVLDNERRFNKSADLSNELRNQSAIRINIELKNISLKNNRITFVDCFNLFYDKETKSAKIEYMIGPGTAHLNDAGYRKWAEFLLEYLP